MQTTSSLNISDSAAKRVRALMSDDNVGLRVFVEGGGCSGFQYGFQLESQIGDDDLVMQSNGVTLLVDALSAQYMMGAEVDYLDDLMGARFFVNNPNASTTCGCGSSFAI